MPEQVSSSDGTVASTSVTIPPSSMTSIAPVVTQQGVPITPTNQPTAAVLAVAAQSASQMTLQPPLLHSQQMLPSGGAMVRASSLGPQTVQLIQQPSGHAFLQQQYMVQQQQQFMLQNAAVQAAMQGMSTQLNMAQALPARPSSVGTSPSMASSPQCVAVTSQQVMSGSTGTQTVRSAILSNKSVSLMPIQSPVSQQAVTSQHLQQQQHAAMFGQQKSMLHQQSHPLVIGQLGVLSSPGVLSNAGTGNGQTMIVNQSGKQMTANCQQMSLKATPPSNQIRFTPQTGLMTANQLIGANTPMLGQLQLGGGAGTQQTATILSTQPLYIRTGTLSNTPHTIVGNVQRPLVTQSQRKVSGGTIRRPPTALVQPKLQPKPAVQTPKPALQTPKPAVQTPNTSDMKTAMVCTNGTKATIENCTQHISASTVADSTHDKPTLTTATEVPPGVEKQRAVVKPHILTHVIEGFVIQESPQPFPVQRSSLLTDRVSDTVNKAPPLLKSQTDIAMSSVVKKKPRIIARAPDGSSVKLKCEFCNKIDMAHKFRRSKRFCSMACAKRFNVACSRRYSLFSSQSARFGRNKRAQQMKHRSWKQGVNTATVPATERADPTACDTQQPLETAINAVAPDSHIDTLPDAVSESSIETSEQSSTSSGADESAPPPELHREVTTMTAMVVATPSDTGVIQSPTQWTVTQVYEFVGSLPGCALYADEFQRQEIDGQALMLLKEDHLMSAMSIKLGPALKICAHINALRQQIT